MKKATVSIVFLAGLLILGVATAFAARGNGNRGHMKLTVMQNGVEVTEARSGEIIEIQGTGFRPSKYDTVCLNPGVCHQIRIDENGSFMQTRMFEDVMGTHQIDIQVHQYKGSKGSVSASVEITISE